MHEKNDRSEGCPKQNNKLNGVHKETHLGTLAHPDPTLGLRIVRMAVEYVYALHDFVPQNDDEIDFEAGERIEVIEKDDLYGDGWWTVSIHHNV